MNSEELISRVKKEFNLKLSKKDADTIIEIVDQYATSQTEALKKEIEELKLMIKAFKGNLILSELFAVASIKNEDGMAVIEYIDKPNGGSIAYIRHDAMVKKINSQIELFLTPPKQ